MASEPSCCGACAHLAAVGEAPDSPPSTPPLRFSLGADGVPRDAWIVLRERQVAIDRPRTVIGRAAGCDLVIKDDALSRRTCALEFDGDGQCFVVDLDSACGVIVEDRQVRRAGLHVGDRVRVGNSVFTVELRPITNR